MKVFFSSPHISFSHFTFGERFWWYSRKTGKKNVLHLEAKALGLLNSMGFSCKTLSPEVHRTIDLEDWIKIINAIFPALEKDNHSLAMEEEKKPSLRKVYFPHKPPSGTAGSIPPDAIRDQRARSTLQKRTVCSSHSLPL